MNRGLTEIEYMELVSKITSTMQKFNQQTDKDFSHEAKKFIQSIENVTTNKEEFLLNIQKRLLKLESTIRNRSELQWFKDKVDTNRKVLNSFKLRLEDPNSPKHFSAETLEGFKILERLLNIPPQQLNEQHVEDIKKYKKCIQDLKSILLVNSTPKEPEKIIYPTPTFKKEVDPTPTPTPLVPQIIKPNTILNTSISYNDNEFVSLLIQNFDTTLTNYLRTTDFQILRLSEILKVYIDLLEKWMENKKNTQLSSSSATSNPTSSDQPTHQYEMNHVNTLSSLLKNIYHLIIQSQNEITSNESLPYHLKVLTIISHNMSSYYHKKQHLDEPRSSTDPIEPSNKRIIFQNLLPSFIHKVPMTIHDKEPYEDLKELLDYLIPNPFLNDKSTNGFEKQTPFLSYQLIDYAKLK